MDRLLTKSNWSMLSKFKNKLSEVFLVYIFYEYIIINDWFGLKKQAQGKDELELQAIKGKIMSLYEKNKQWLF